IEPLNNLIHVDRDAILAYEQAIDACEVPEIRTKLSVFAGDHERHVRDLELKVRALGGEPAAGRDIKGFFIKGFTALASQGDRSALVAMRTNEELTIRAYHAALEEEHTEDVRLLIEQNYQDEVSHLEWIKETLENRGWEKVKAA